MTDKKIQSEKRRKGNKKIKATAELPPFITDTCNHVNSDKTL